jgi:hypothetical protein
MKKVSCRLPFDSTPEQTKMAFRKLVLEVYKNRLGRTPRKEDETAFKQIVNPENSSINDLYFQEKKIGNVAITYILDIPREINLEYKPNPYTVFVTT